MNLSSQNLHKIHSSLFRALILLLPTQLTIFFFPQFSLIQGIRIDYLAISLYLTDFILVGLIGGFLIDQVKQKKLQLYPEKTGHQILLFVSCSILGLSILFAAIPILALIKTVRIIMLLCLVLYIVKTKQTAAKVKPYLIIAGVYSTILAWAQFLTQRSIGGLLYWIGERAFTITTPGIATTTIDGSLVLRPYATFPHPNVLGGFLTIVFIFVLFSKPLFFKTKQSVLFGLLAAVIASGIVISFSRSAIVVSMLMLFFYVVLLGYYAFAHTKHTVHKRFFVLVVCSIAIGTLLIGSIVVERFLLLRYESDPYTIRQELLSSSRGMIQDHPLFGVGVNNFIVKLPAYQTIESYEHLQPVHSLYFLTAAEVGILGVALFLALLTLCYKRLFIAFSKNNLSWFVLFLSLTSIVLLGLVDHYFITLWQLMILFSLVIGLCLIAESSLNTIQSK